MRFSIGAGDRQALQPPVVSTLPVTHVAVAMLFQQLGESSLDGTASVQKHAAFMWCVWLSRGSVHGLFILDPVLDHLTTQDPPCLVHVLWSSAIPSDVATICVFIYI